MSGREIRIVRRQTGTVKNPFKDMRLYAMYPGKRISRNGKPYWELRKNRSDLDKSRRF